MMFRSILLVFCLSCSASAKAEVVVFAAASLKEPVDALAASLGNVVVSYGGSGTLARQVSFGAPADVVLLANVDWMDFLKDGEHVLAESIADIASNRLVLIGAADMPDVALDLGAIQTVLGDGRIAIGLTRAVPAGIYAKAALVSLGLWDGLEPHLAEAESVRSALALVARGQAPLGIVYQTDVRVSDAVRQVAVFPAGSHPDIRYQGALTNDASPEAAAFLAALIGPAGQAHLVDAGFLPPLPEAR
jgi:molybdate transport system substrate-binding protein